MGHPIIVVAGRDEKKRCGLQVEFLHLHSQVLGFLFVLKTVSTPSNKNKNMSLEFHSVNSTKNVTSIKICVDVPSPFPTVCFVECLPARCISV